MIKWGDAAMSFANGQTRMRGSRTNEYKAEGGKRITGVLLGTGESLPQSDVAGQFYRQLQIDASKSPPLGCTSTIEGRDRAKLLDKAAERGSGVLGGEFIQFVLEHWEEFKSEYEKTQAEFDWRFKAYTDAMCLCITSLRFLFRMLGITKTNAIDVMIKNIAAKFSDDSADPNHPAEKAFDVIRSMISTSERAKNVAGGMTEWLDYYKYRNTPFCWTNDGNYAIPATSYFIKDRLGDISSFYTYWVNKGYILPGNDSPTKLMVSKINGSVRTRCIVIPGSLLKDSVAAPSPAAQPAMSHP